MSTEFELQKALYARLSGSAETGLSGKAVYDDGAVPEATDPPYVTIGEFTTNEWDTDDSVGREVTVTIHSWSDYRGGKEVREMMDGIKAELHNKALTVTGETVVQILQEYSGSTLDPDGVTRHGVQRFRLLMEGN